MHATYIHKKNNNTFYMEYTKDYKKCTGSYIHVQVHKNLCDISPLSPYLTGLGQLETSLRIVHDYFATKFNDINTTFMLQSH